MPLGEMSTSAPSGLSLFARLANNVLSKYKYDAILCKQIAYCCSFLFLKMILGTEKGNDGYIDNKIIAKLLRQVRKL